MEECTPNVAEGLVLDRPTATAVVWRSDDLSPTEGFVLLRLLACTTGARAETSHAELARACKLDKRTLTRVMPRLREAGWFALETRGSYPSWFHWNPNGPLREAWVKPGPRALVAALAPRISDAEVSNPLR